MKYVWADQSMGCSCLIAAKHETSSTLGWATYGMQNPLELYDIHVCWSQHMKRPVQFNARSNASHLSTSRNIALAAKSDTPTSPHVGVPQKVTLQHHDWNAAPATTSRTTICYRQTTWSVIYNMLDDSNIILFMFRPWNCKREPVL